MGYFYHRWDPFVTCSVYHSVLLIAERAQGANFPPTGGPFRGGYGGSGGMVAVAVLEWLSIALGASRLNRIARPATLVPRKLTLGF